MLRSYCDVGSSRFPGREADILPRGRSYARCKDWVGRQLKTQFVVANQVEYQSSIPIGISPTRAFVDLKMWCLDSGEEEASSS